VGVRFAEDSTLEGDGFEPSVPRWGSIFSRPPRNPATEKPVRQPERILTIDKLPRTTSSVAIISTANLLMVGRLSLRDSQPRPHIGGMHLDRPCEPFEVPGARPDDCAPEFQSRA